MSIFSFVRGGRTSVSTNRRSAAVASRRSILASACIETLEDRRLMSVTNPVLVSQSTAGVVGDNESAPTSAGAPGFGPKVSDNGRYVVFDSSATNLDPAYTVTSDEVYIRDTVNGTTKLVSVDSLGQPLPNSYVADITGDGRYVLFFSTGANTRLYRRDTVSNSTIIVSIGYNEFTRVPIPIEVSADPSTHNPTFPAAISADGNRVAFATPNEFVLNSYRDINGTDDIFVRDLTSATNYLVTTTLTRDPGFGELAYSFSMNAGGTVVAYDSLEYYSTTVGLRQRVNVHNVTLGTTIDVSSGFSTNTTTPGAFSSSYSTISKDGSTVAFLSDDPVLSGAAQGSTTVITPQVILAKINRTSNTLQDITLASHGLFGGPSIGSSMAVPRLSYYGDYVIFLNDGDDLVYNPTAGVNLYRYDYNADAVEIVSSKANNVTAVDSRIGISDDGRFIVWSSDATDSDRTVTTYGAPGQFNAYARDMQSFDVRLLNTALTDSTSASNADSYSVAISADGKYITFLSDATDLDLADITPLTDVYICPTPEFPPGFLIARLNASDVYIGGDTSYYFTVTYNGSLPIDYATIGDGDLTVTYGGFSAVASLLQGSINLATDGTPISATYYISPPGGFWDNTDNTLPPNGNTAPDRYVISLRAREVSDIQGDPFPAQELGSFKVDISYANNDGKSISTTVPESAGTKTVFFTRTDSLPGPITVTYSTIRGTATPGTDYTETTGTLTFNPGETLPVTIPILSDSLIEGDETFRIVLSNATTGALFSYQQAIVTILDDDTPTPAPSGGTVFVPSDAPFDVVTKSDGRKIYFNNGAPVITAPETLSSLLIPISRKNTGSETVDATFNYTVYSVPSDTAVSGVNYVAVDSGTFTIPAGSDAADLVVQLLHDNQVTGDRTFTVVLSNATNGLVIGGTSIQVVIRDVDSSVQFANSSVNITDDAGIIDIPVTRVGNVTPGSKVHLSFGGTAIAGTDYTVVADGVLDDSGYITFAPGETSRVVHVQILNRDALLGTSRTITLSLDSAQALATSDPFAYGTVLGTPSSENVVINYVDGASPQVSAVDFKVDNGRINKVLVTFNEAVTKDSAKKLSNYALFTRNRNGKLGRLIRLSSATYDPATHTVTLTPAGKLALNRTFQINVNGKGTITDLAGNGFDGDADGKAGGSFNGIFGSGRSLKYGDPDDKDLVSFSLKGPGNLKLTSLNSEITVDVLDADGENTTLLGSVTKRKGGNGKTTLDLLRLHGATFDADESKFDGDIRADA